MLTNTQVRPTHSIATRILSQLAVLATAMIGLPSIALAQSAESGATGGISAIWIFANLSFAGMRAQDGDGMFWKVVCFVFGFPATLLTLMVVTKGSERAYGIDMLRRRDDVPSRPLRPGGSPPSRPPAWNLPE